MKTSTTGVAYVTFCAAWAFHGNRAIMTKMRQYPLIIESIHNNNIHGDCGFIILWQS